MATTSSAPSNGLYQPLDNDKKEIRVLDVLPGRKNSPVRCHIKIISLADGARSPPYDALSYTWRSSEQRKTIFI